jgi:hypothetical protein
MNVWLSEPRKSSNKLSKFLFSILILLVAFAAGGYLTKNYRLSKVIVLPSSTKIDLAYLNNQNLLLVNSGWLQKTIQQQNPQVKSLTITKQWPSSLIIRLTLEQSLAQLNNRTEYLILNEEGKILNRQAKKNRHLPEIKYYQHLRSFETSPGEKLRPTDILYALELIKKQKQIPLDFNEISITNIHELEAKLADQPYKLIFSSKKSIAKIIFIMQNINKTLQVKGLKPRMVNIRFSKPVLTL